MTRKQSPADDLFERRWRTRFGEYARGKDDDAGIAGWSRTGLETRFRHFARVWRGDQPGAAWLDVGCGAGTYTRFLHDQHMHAFGVDYSLPTILKARARSPVAIAWGVADATRLPFRTGTFDGVLCFGVTQTLADSAPAVRELCRVARPGGSVWIDALNSRCPPNIIEVLVRRLRSRPQHLRYESPGALRRLLENSGLVAVRVYWVPILPARWRRLQPLLEGSAVRWLLHAIPWLGMLLSHAFVVAGSRRADPSC